MGMFPGLYLAGNHIITPWSQVSIGPASVSQGGTALGGTLASTVFPAANDALFIPFQLSESVTVKRVGWANGATVSGNVDMGVYDLAGTRIFSTGSTAQSGVSGIQVVDITDVVIGPGNFYMALACDNITATFARGTVGSLARLRMFCGVLKQATAFALPAAATFATPTDDYVPVMALFLQTAG